MTDHSNRFSIAVLAGIFTVIFVSASLAQSSHEEQRSQFMLDESDDDNAVISYVLQPDDPARTVPQPRSRLRERTRRGRSARGLRSASAPNMIGDFYLNGPSISQIKDGFGTIQTADVVGYRAKVSENNSPIPRHRVFFNYHHYHNALQFTGVEEPPPTSLYTSSASVDRYVFGFEKPFHDDHCSLEIRIPFTGDAFFAAPAGAPVFESESGGFGNISITTKVLFMARENFALGGGLSIGLPTGENATGMLSGGFDTFELANNAVHLVPFLGFVSTPRPSCFFQGFFQVDAPLNANRITATGFLGTESRPLPEQTLLAFDLQGGVWLYIAPQARLVTAVASVFELHYTTTLNDAAEVDLPLSSLFSSIAGNRRMDILNCTIGIHLELMEKTTVRVGGVFPLRHGNDAPWDAEFNVSVNRFF